jgi:RimJ/RimL family protein N-acetyltransferase
MWVEPVVLAGRVVRLEPLRAEHWVGLWRVAEPDIFDYMPRPQQWTPEDFQVHLQELIERPASCPFTMVLQASNQPIGVTTYMDIRAPHRALEIGSTWLAKAHQGTKVNPEAKYLLLRHAFEGLGAVRVQLKTDLRNLQSQRAIAKLGAQREGVLRRHLILTDGYIRDSVMYSIIPEEWPGVKAGLEARLGYTP